METIFSARLRQLLQDASRLRPESEDASVINEAIELLRSEGKIDSATGLDGVKKQIATELATVRILNAAQSFRRHTAG